MSINRVSLTGNLTRDPELRQTAGGTPVLNFGVAINERHKNAQTGEWEDRPVFVSCVLFGHRAESLSNILRRGFKVALDGKLRFNQWTDQQTGQKRSRLDVLVDDVDFMQAKQGGGGYQQPAPEPAPEPTYSPAYDDETPF